MASVQMFQWGSIGLWALIVVLLLTLWKRQRHFLWSVLAITLNFTLEPFYDQHFLLRYSEQFIPILPRVAVPLMIPFAYGTLYTVPLLISIWLFKRFPQIPGWAKFFGMWAFMFATNMAQEGIFTGGGAWDYFGWTPASYGLGGQPWIVPVGVALNLPAFYFSHVYASEASDRLETNAQKFLLFLGVFFFASLLVWLANAAILAIYGGPN